MGCKQGILIGRNTEVITRTLTSGSVGNALLLPPDADRIGLFAGISNWVPATDTDVVIVGVRRSNVGVPLLSITRDHWFEFVGIEEVGTIIQEAIFGIQQPDAEGTFAIGSVRLRTPLKDI